MNNIQSSQKIPQGRQMYGGLMDHQHDGLDSIRINYKDINRKKVIISHTIQGANAQTATNYGVFFINEMSPCYVSKFCEVHQTKGTHISPVTLTLEKLTGTTAPDSGTEILNSALSLKANDNTVQSGIININYSNLDIGDRLCLKDSGILMEIVNVTVFVELTLS